MSRERVLALLRERQGEYCSGEAMSRLLGISRAGGTQRPSFHISLAASPAPAARPTLSAGAQGKACA